jgi:uncharacterized protein YbaP (TraB family)
LINFRARKGKGKKKDESRSYLERRIDRYFCQDIMKQGKKVLALEFMGFILDCSVFDRVGPDSYQERALSTELCGPAYAL